MFNVTFLQGRLSSAPVVRTLDSGSRLATLQITVRVDGQRASSVPVAVWDPPSHVEALGAGDEVAVLGRVERRFFALAPGGRGSRVEVVADAVASLADRRRVTALRQRARRVLAGSLGGKAGRSEHPGPGQPR